LKIKTISLWQPWASLIALNLKRYETRGWATNYRGELAIHAAKRPLCKEGKRLIAYLKEFHGQTIDLDRLPLGAIIAIVDLTDCLSMGSEGIVIGSVPKLERMIGDWQPCRYAWKLENVREIEPIPYLGRQKLFTAEIENITVQ
jgi:activating signal cointegrator 1